MGKKRLSETVQIWRSCRSTFQNLLIFFVLNGNSNTTGDGEQLYSLCRKRLEREGTDDALSFGRHCMSTAFLEGGSNSVLAFGGGMAPYEGNVDGSMDMLSNFDGTYLNIEVDSLSMPRTDMASAVTNSAIYVTGGCGLYDDPIRNGFLLVNDCQPTDLIDVYAPNLSETSSTGKQVITMRNTSGYRLCEPKYATTTGVFWTGRADEGSEWAQTAHVIVAGGIIGAGDGLYKATDTIDIIREEWVAMDGVVSLSNLPVQRLPQPRFDMSSCCFKHVCVFAGGQLNLGGYYSDRVDVWSGLTWGWSSAHTLSEARYGMGTAAVNMKVYSGEVLTIGFFAGGYGSAGNLYLIDLYDFSSDRWLSTIHLPTVRGMCTGANLGPDAAVFIADTGEVDVFNSTSLCWTSFMVNNLALGAATVGRAPQWYFDPQTMAGMDPGYYKQGDSGVFPPEGKIFIGGGIYEAAHGLSSQLDELRWELENINYEDPVLDFGKCQDGKSEKLRPVQTLCGEMLPGDQLSNFRSPSDVMATTPPVSHSVKVDDPYGSHNEEGWYNHLSMHTRLVFYIMIGALALLISYMISASLILRQTEGIWRLPFGGGILHSLVGAFSIPQIRYYGGSWRSMCYRRETEYSYETIQRSSSSSPVEHYTKNADNSARKLYCSHPYKVIVTHSIGVEDFHIPSTRNGHSSGGLRCMGTLMENDLDP